jgi:HK97 family phage prohead protease
MPNKKELRYQAAKELRVQTAADGSRTISGYAIRYNEPSVDLGGFTEIVAPGAVTESLKRNPSVLCLRDHDPSLLMGRTTAKTLTLTEDANGLLFLCKLPTTASANDLAESIDRGDLDGVSFGFSVPNGGDKWSNDGSGNVVRTLLKIDLAEISPCSFPAYPSTSVSIRSCPPKLRSLLNRSQDDEDEDEDGCDCDCPECLDGDCADCSDPDCIDEDCEHGEDSARSVALFKLELRIALAKRL